jgi:hypothetical protein
MTIKAYSSRTSAVRGLGRHLGAANTPDLDISKLIRSVDGQFQFDTDEADKAAGLSGLSEGLENIKLATGHSHCPGCNIELDNGWCDFEGMVDTHGSEKAAFKVMKHEFTCLACGHEWGKPIELKAANSSRVNKTGRTYPNRQHSDIATPSEVVFALADAMPGAKRKEVVDAAIAGGVTPNTARAAYQHWRKARGLSKTA